MVGYAMWKLLPYVRHIGIRNSCDLVTKHSRLIARKE